MAAADAILSLLEVNSEVIAIDDLYGGTRRLFEKVAAIVKEENRPLLIFPQGTRVKTNEIIP